MPKPSPLKAASTVHPPALVTSAATPPMGWNSFNTFGCEPSADLVVASARALVDSGLAEAGYRYVNIDDGWMAKQRGPGGQLVPHPDKFPQGLAPVVQAIHELGLHIGTYLGGGLRTYGEYPGSLGHEAADVRLLTDLGFDWLKYDYRSLPEDPPRGGVPDEYRALRQLLDASGHPVALSICEHGRSKPWEWGHGVGQLWRTSPDIKDGYEGNVLWGWGFLKIADRCHQLHGWAGPGGWNDPDMLIVGLNGKIDWQGPGCTPAEYRAHFALWCLMAAPLIIGCDPRAMDAAALDLMTNPRLLAIDQDRLGVQGRIARKDIEADVWYKPLSAESFALGLHNRSSWPQSISVRWSELGLAGYRHYQLADAWTAARQEVSGQSFSLEVPPHELAVFHVQPAASTLFSGNVA